MSEHKCDKEKCDKCGKCTHEIVIVLKDGRKHHKHHHHHHKHYEHKIHIEIDGKYKEKDEVKDEVKQDIKQDQDVKQKQEDILSVAAVSGVGNDVNTGNEVVQKAAEEAIKKSEYDKKKRR